MKKILVYSALMLIFSLIWACGSIFRDSEPKPPTISEATYVGDKACLACHDDTHPDLMAAYKASIHGSILDFEAFTVRRGCESCHGAGSLHAESSDPATIFNLKKLKTDEVSAICLECHRRGALMQWRGSEHALNNISCIDCHRLHQPRSVTTTKEAGAPSSAWQREIIRPHALSQAEPELCYSCHKDISLQFGYASHHPLPEAKMVCSECHEPHGGPKHIRIKGRMKNDLCLSCHPQYQGPFFYNHPPVEENCNICHEPHGAVVNNLLSKTEPFLCAQCHYFHPPIHIEPSLAQTVGKRCIYCHQEIHGSNIAPNLGLK